MTEKLIRSVRKAGADIAAYLDGDASRVRVKTVCVPDDIDVKAVREKLALSQAQFADLFGFKLSTVQSWERKRKRRKPTGPARMLLAALDRNPEAVLSALTA